MHNFTEILGQNAAIEPLQRAMRLDRLPHGLIFAGPNGVGKQTTAAALGKLFLCEKPKGEKACGTCQSCKLFDAGNHPDYHLVYRQLARLEREKIKAMELSIDVIRQFLVGPANLKSAMGRGKFFVVQEAELLNAAAQNGMLKTLEEPAGRTAIVLLTDQPESLLATIRSRCQVIRFAPLPSEIILKKLAERGIDAATAKAAAELSERSLGKAIQWIEDGVIDAARELYQMLAAPSHTSGDLASWYSRAAENYATKQLERDELASKDQATREGLTVYLHLTAQYFQKQLTDPATNEHACKGIEAISHAEMFLDANVNVPIVLAQLAMAITSSRHHVVTSR
jgi:DNA polymerase-3 subunit delta'